jgi:hypothetical protein
LFYIYSDIVLNEGETACQLIQKKTESLVLDLASYI